MMHDRIRAQSRCVHSTCATHASYDDFLLMDGSTPLLREEIRARQPIGALDAIEFGVQPQESWNLALRIPCGIGSALRTRYFANLLAWRKFRARSSAGADFLRRQENGPRLPCLLAEVLAGPKRCRRAWHWAATKSSRSPPLAFLSTADLRIPAVLQAKDFYSRTL